MKRIFTILAVFFVVGVFTSKAQSPSDSSYVRDLNYTFFNMSSLPNSITDSLANGSKILKDLRSGMRGKGYAITVNFDALLDIQLVSGAGGWDSYLFLLDANFQKVAYNDDWRANGSSSYGSRITHEVTAGQYYIIVSEYSKNTTNRPYTLTVDTISVTPLNQLTFTPVSFPFSIQDTFSTEDPTIFYEDVVLIAKGYSFQGTQGKVLMYDEDSTMGMDDVFLLDNNYNVTPLWNVVTKLPYTGTYYLLLLSQKAPQPFSIKAEMKDMTTLYVDGVNGDDSRNGLTAGTAIKTLDTAIARTAGVGKYLLTDDYTFNNEDCLGVYCAEIYPYGKDINLKISDNCSEDIFEIYSSMIFGENGSDYYFIIDSSSSTGYYDFLDADYYGTTLEVNNLKIRNSHMPNTIFWGDSIVLRNCEFTNDTIYHFVGIEEDQYNSLKLINCNISQNRFRSTFIYQDYDSMKVTLENTTISGNYFKEDYPVTFYAAKINLTSGNWRNNNLMANYYSNGNPNLNSQNCAGIWAIEGTIVNIGAGFTMDVNNYLCIDSTSIINVDKNLTGPVVAQVYPCRYDNSDYKYYGDYYEGRPMLIGSAVANNFQKFSVAQADNNSLWYLHSDGKLYTTVDPNGIAQAEVSEVRMYPNPAADRVTIDLQNTTANKIRMVDLYGRIVVEQDVDGQMEMIDLSNLANGMYFVQICNNGKVTATRKLMKN
ncbi:MAG: T9SS type A sorting domain-containing protein [Bacteroidales bacterium]|nr:T9SS type A sorting domain-containing protein [Bacteroidales bacterium]